MKMSRRCVNAWNGRPLDRLRNDVASDSAAARARERRSMKKALLTATAVASLLGLAACSDKAQNEANEAAEAMAADVNVTMGEAVNDVDAASEQAFGAAENSIDSAGDAIGNATKDLGNAIED
jgi:hypothetical protein